MAFQRGVKIYLSLIIAFKNVSQWYFRFARKLGRLTKLAQMTSFS